MHPLIRVLVFLVFSISLALGEWQVLLAGAFLIQMVRWRTGLVVSDKGWQMLKRLRWFFLSIMVIYLWFTPGDLLLPALAGWSPSYEGVWLALIRAGSLSLIVVAVDLLLQSTPREQLLGALYRLVLPLRPLGFSAERFALRMTLTLEAVSEFSLDQHKGSPGSQKQQTVRQRMSALTDALADNWLKALQPMGKPETMEILLDKKPVLREWLIPVLLLVFFFLISRWV